MVGVLVVAVLWTPVWFQVVLFALAVTFLPKKALFLIPAIIADILYAPTMGFGFDTLKMTLIVGGMIVIWIAIISQTRIEHVVPTK